MEQVELELNDAVRIFVAQWLDTQAWGFTFWRELANDSNIRGNLGVLREYVCANFTRSTEENNGRSVGMQQYLACVISPPPPFLEQYLKNDRFKNKKYKCNFSLISRSNVNIANGFFMDMIFMLHNSIWHSLFLRFAISLYLRSGKAHINMNYDLPHENFPRITHLAFRVAIGFKISDSNLHHRWYKKKRRFFILVLEERDWFSSIDSRM